MNVRASCKDYVRGVNNMALKPLVLVLTMACFAAEAKASPSCDRASNDAELLSLNEETARTSDHTQVLRHGSLTATEDKAAEARIFAYREKYFKIFKGACKPGDTIRNSKFSVIFAQQLCNLSKQVVDIGDATICAMK